MARKRRTPPGQEPEPRENAGTESAPPRWRWLRPAVVAAVAVVVVAAAGWALYRASAGGDAGAASADFVGVTTCAGCHAQEHAAWQASHHDLAMQEAREGTVLGDFEDASFTYGNVTSTFFRRGASFMVRTDGKDGRLHDYEVKYTFGVEPLQQYLIELSDGRLQPLSVSWDSRPAEEGGQRWFHLYPGERIEHTDDVHWTGLQQNWNFMCADCHSTGLRKGYDAQANRFRTTWSEIDVACEACHGPGSRHVDWAEAPSLVRGLLWKDAGLTAPLDERRGVHWAADSATGRPTRSAPRTTDREIQVCAQCHSRRAQIADDYVAGAPFDDHYVVSLLMPGLYYPDGQQQDEVYIHGSFLQSRMYHAGVTCSDCHDPHSQKLRAPGNAVCGQCHAPPRYDTPAHTFHPAGTEGALCVSCHMPETTYMQVDPRRDHSIRVPRPDQSVALGVPNACSGCHADRSAAWAAERVRSWYGRDARGFQSFAEAFHAHGRREPGAAAALAEVATAPAQPAVVRASALARLADHPGVVALEAARVGVDDEDPVVRRAALHLLEPMPPQERIGYAAPLLTDPSLSVRVQAAWLLAPVAASLIDPELREAFASAAEEFIASQRYHADRPENRTTLGTFFSQLGRYAEAAAEYRAALKLAPRFVPAYVNLADLLRSQGQEAEAARTLREGLAAAPDDPSLHHALGLSLARSGELPRAVASLQRAAALAPEQPRFAYAAAVALHSSGRVAEAIRLLEEARSRHPTDRDVLFALATFHRDAGDTEQARRFASLLSSAHPNDAEASALLRSLGSPTGR